MADITLYDQLRIVSGLVKPPSDTLTNLVQQGGAQYAKTFMETYKIFPTDDGADPPVPINVTAADYLNKMINICARMFRADGAAINSLMRIMVVLIGVSGKTMAQVEAATDSQWEEFIETNITKAFELSASITQQEKTAYDDIV